MKTNFLGFLGAFCALTLFLYSPFLYSVDSADSERIGRSDQPTEIDFDPSNPFLAPDPAGISTAAPVPAALNCGAELIPADVFLAPGSSVDEYILERKLVESGFSHVWVAHPADLPDVQVVLKFSKDLPTARQALEVEERFHILIDQLNVRSIGLVRAVKRNALSDYRYLVFPYIEGQTFRKFLNEEKPLHENLEVFLEILDAIAVLHAKGFVHFDLKPENFLISKEGDVSVIDLALMWSKVYPGIHVLPAYWGTPRYIALELKRGDQKNYGPWSDVFALGVTLEEIIEASALDQTKEHQRLVKRLERIFLKAQQTEGFKDRQKNAAELAQEIREALRPRMRDRLERALRFIPGFRS